jgi:hypothetical protein
MKNRMTDSLTNFIRHPVHVEKVWTDETPMVLVKKKEHTLLFLQIQVTNQHR